MQREQFYQRLISAAAVSSYITGNRLGGSIEPSFHPTREKLPKAEEETPQPRLHYPSLYLGRGSLTDETLLAELRERIIQEGMSVSDLNAYVDCPYKFFCSFVLRLRPPEEASLEVGALERGNIIHTVLERFWRSYLTGPLPSLQRAQAEIEGLLREEYGEYGEEPPLSEIRMLRTFIRTDLKVAQAGFRPAHLERRFSGLAVETAEGPVEIRGRIDRIDVSPEGHYVLYDYKTGSAPSGPALMRGEDVQIAAYLLAARDLLPKGQNVGVAYYKLDGKRSGIFHFDHYQRLLIPKGRTCLADDEFQARAFFGQAGRSDGIFAGQFPGGQRNLKLQLLPVPGDLPEGGTQCMSFIPTPQQEKAITTIDRHVAVTAGAGSGKTRVLVERYLNLLEHGVAVENIAAITFTKKAAQEMKDRLCKLRPDLIAELEQAQISTIHSLCQRIIQEHPLEAAVDPRFRIGEEWETQILLLQTIEDLVDGADRPEALGNRSAAEELIRDLYEQMMRKGDLNFRQKVVRPNTGFSPVALRAKGEEFLQLEPHTNSQRKAMEELAEEWPVHSAALEFAQVELQLEAMEAILTPIKKISGKFAEEVKPLRYELEEAQQYLQHVQAAEIVEWLGEMLEKVHENFTAAKRSRGLMDFNDLEHLAYQLLLNPSVREDYPFDHLMVDEFQDTNPLQKKIVVAFVSGGSLLFVVSDPKQSIYRFRGADVGVFMQTKRKLPQGRTSSWRRTSGLA